MKISIDIDCTPEEARTFLGLPDMAPVHTAFTAKVEDAIRQGVSPDMVEGMIRSFAPMGEAGMKLWGGLFEQIVKPKAG